MSPFKFAPTAGITLALAAYCAVVHAASDPELSIEWTRRFGSTENDNVSGVSVNVFGDIYTTGTTRGNLAGPNAGNNDVFVAKYAVDGTAIWSRQFGTSVLDDSTDISTDEAGNIYVAGHTAGNLAGFKGVEDAFLAKFDTAGNRLWTRQLGTTSFDGANGVSADGLGNVYIAGGTSGNLGGTSNGSTDAFISKYNAAGNVIWTRQLGTSTIDVANDVSADGLGNVYISGRTNGSLGGPNANGPSTSSSDVFVAKYDANGNLAWTRQFGTTGSDESFDISVDKLGNVFASGLLADLTNGYADAFVAKYDAAGAIQWLRNFDANYCRAIAADGLGNAYVTAGFDALGLDASAIKFDSAGSVAWTMVLGTTGDHLTAVAVDGANHVYVGGSTFTNLGGPSVGGGDAFLIKIFDVPEPSAFGLAAICLLCTSFRTRKHG